MTIVSTAPNISTLIPNPLPEPMGILCESTLDSTFSSASSAGTDKILWNIHPDKTIEFIDNIVVAANTSITVGKQITTLDEIASKNYETFIVPFYGQTNYRNGIMFLRIDNQKKLVFRGAWYPSGTTVNYYGGSSNPLNLSESLIINLRGIVIGCGYSLY